MPLPPLQFDFFGILSNVNAFVMLMIGIGGAIGSYAQKLSIAVFGALLIYVYVVINTDLFIFNALLYLVLAIILLWVSMHVVSGYFEGNSEANG